MGEQTAKRRFPEALGELPEDGTIEETFERLCFIAKVEDGLRQSEAGELIRHEGVKKQLLS